MDNTIENFLINLDEENENNEPRIIINDPEYFSISTIN